jgi:hypothetical protein
MKSYTKAKQMNFVDNALQTLENNLHPHLFIQTYKTDEEITFKNEFGTEIIYKHRGSRYITIHAKSHGCIYTPIYYLNSDMY